MCGCFALYSPYPRLAESLRLPLEKPDTELSPRYNVAPGTFITAGGKRTCIPPKSSLGW